MGTFRGSGGGELLGGGGGVLILPNVRGKNILVHQTLDGCPNTRSRHSTDGATETVGAWSLNKVHFFLFFVKTIKTESFHPYDARIILRRTEK